MTNDKTAKMLERVRALLAKADSTTFPEEAETFRQKADELMTTYAIDAWMVEQAQAGVGVRPEPEVRYVDFNWWYDNKQADQLWHLYHSVARHCRVVVGLRGHGKNRSYREMPVIGLPSDVDYLDMLFTHLMLQMGRNLEVRPDAKLPLDENVYHMRMAGMGWMRITRLLWEAKMIDPPRGKAGVTRLLDADTHQFVEVRITGETPWDGITNAARAAIKNRLANLNRAYSRQNGLPRNYVRPEVYQRSYADGFVNEVAHRLRKMNRATAAAYDANHNEGSMALAVRDIREVALALYEQMWPAPEPSNKKGRSVATRQVAFDAGAYQTGTVAGAKADIASPASERIGNRGSLPR